MFLLGLAISVAASGLNPNVLIQAYRDLSQAFTLDDLAKGILDNDYIVA